MCIVGVSWATYVCCRCSWCLWVSPLCVLHVFLVFLLVGPCLYCRCFMGHLCVLLVFLVSLWMGLCVLHCSQCLCRATPFVCVAGVSWAPCVCCRWPRCRPIFRWTYCVYFRSSLGNGSVLQVFLVSVWVGSQCVP